MPQMIFLCLCFASSFLPSSLGLGGRKLLANHFGAVYLKTAAAAAAPERNRTENDGWKLEERDSVITSSDDAGSTAGKGRKKKEVASTQRGPQHCVGHVGVNIWQSFLVFFLSSSLLSCASCFAEWWFGEECWCMSPSFPFTKQRSQAGRQFHRQLMLVASTSGWKRKSSSFEHRCVLG